MKITKYKCPNGCKLLIRRKTICQNRTGTYYWGIPDFTYCPSCGALMPETLEKIKGFFELCHIHPKLERAVGLVYKSELEAAVREAIVVLETTLQEKSGLSNLWGKDLAAQALKIKYDSKQKLIIEQPLIAINKLDSPSRINEQEGIMHMLMGFFQGTRNIYQHKQVGTSANMIIFTVLQVSYFLKLLDGHSITVNGQWIPQKTSPAEILKNTPNRIDRIKIAHMLIKSTKKIKKRELECKEKLKNENQRNTT